jgi:hypothetical protein
MAGYCHWKKLMRFSTGVDHSTGVTGRAKKDIDAILPINLQASDNPLPRPADKGCRCPDCQIHHVDDLYRRVNHRG